MIKKANIIKKTKWINADNKIEGFIFFMKNSQRKKKLNKKITIKDLIFFMKDADMNIKQVKLKQLKALFSLWKNSWKE